MKYLMKLESFTESKTYIKKYENEDVDISILDCQEFYDLMQYYRHIPISKQKDTTTAFKDVKKFINDNFIVKNEKAVKEWLIEHDAKKYNL